LKVFEWKSRIWSLDEASTEKYLCVPSLSLMFWMEIKNQVVFDVFKPLDFSRYNLEKPVVLTLFIQKYSQHLGF
jgi:hypothetical protein